MARKKSDMPGDNGTATFEESLAKLEAVVEAMENSQLPLEDLVKHYEEGASLLRACEIFLKSARERIELITLRAANTTPEEPQASAAPQSEDNDDDDDIRLF